MARYLAHYGIKNMHWGVRRFQYENGILTPEGRERYGYGPGRRGLMTENTKDYIRQGTKRGAKKGAKAGAIGAGIGIGTAATAVGTAAILANPAGFAAAATVIGAAWIGGGAVSGAIGGTTLGFVDGHDDTVAGREFIRSYDAYEKKVMLRDLDKKG